MANYQKKYILKLQVGIKLKVGPMDKITVIYPILLAMLRDMTPLAIDYEHA